MVSKLVGSIRMKYCQLVHKPFLLCFFSCSFQMQFHQCWFFICHRYAKQLTPYPEYILQSTVTQNMHCLQHWPTFLRILSPIHKPSCISDKYCYTELLFICKFNYFSRPLTTKFKSQIFFFGTFCQWSCHVLCSVVLSLLRTVKTI
jgi:hypothetical protein